MLFQEFQFNQYREECLSLSEPFHPARVLVQQKLCKLLEQKAEGEKKKELLVSSVIIEETMRKVTVKVEQVQQATGTGKK